MGSSEGRGVRSVRPDVQYARNGDVALAYQTVGDGPCDVVLVSGFLSNIEYAWMYPSFARFLAGLAEGSRLILMDRRGSGLSDRVSQMPTMETTLADIETVLDEAGSPKTTLVGLWDGCLTSALFAATHPDRTAGLVLFSASAVQTVKDDYPWAWSEEQWVEWLASIRTGWGARSWVVRNARWMGPSMLDDREELEHWITYTRLSASPSSAEAVMRQNKDTDIREVLPVIQAPTLVLHRVDDHIEDIAGARYVAAKIPQARLVELPGADGIPWLGDVHRLLDEIHAFLTDDTGRHADLGRRLATVLFTDIVGSTEHLVALGDTAWRRKLADHDAIAREQLDRHDGRFVASTGDGMVAMFDGPAAAVRCAHAIMRAVSTLQIEIRAGVHTGEVEQDGAQLRGITVHIGARIGALAGPSEVLCSQTVKDLTAGSRLEFEAAGDHDLKGVPGRWSLYRVEASDQNHAGA